MNLNVTIAGHRVPWRLRDSDVVDNWLSTRPWMDRGGLRCIRLGSCGLVHDVAGMLRAAVRGHDDGSSDLCFLALRPSTTLQQALGEALEFPAGLDRHTFLTRVADHSLDRRMILLVDCTEVRDPYGGLREESQMLVELPSKLREGASVTVLVFETIENVVVGGADNLAFGHPLEGVLPVFESGESALWLAYLHSRIAWESGGDLARAVRWSTGMVEHLAIGDDDRFEAFLNEQALKDYDATRAEDRERMDEYLVQAVRRRAGAIEGAAELVRQGYLTRTALEGPLRPSPWLARALLLRRRAGTGAPLLRSCLVAAPLAHEVLSRCFDLEAEERAILVPQLEDDRAPEELRTAWLAARSSRADGFYPRDCPGIPTSPWMFGSFGQVLRSAARDPRVDAARKALRDVRNRVAHGHYVGWTMVRELRWIQRQLAQRR